MNRNLRLSVAFVAAFTIVSLAATVRCDAQGVRYYGLNRTYYNNGYVPRQSGYRVYGNGPYSYGSPVYAPAPSYNYQSYGAGPYGYRTPGSYAGRYNDGSFRQYRGSTYGPYGGAGIYGPFGGGIQFGY